MKTLRLQITDRFPYYHQKFGLPTAFKEMILTGKKIHTIKKFTNIIAEITKEIDKGNDTVYLWQYENVADGSGMETIKTVHKCNYESIIKRDGEWYISPESFKIREETLAINEGLTLQNFKGLWPLEDYDNLVLFYLTTFDYMDPNDYKHIAIQHLSTPDPTKKSTFQTQMALGDVVIKRESHFSR